MEQDRLSYIRKGPDRYCRGIVPGGKREKGDSRSPPMVTLSCFRGVYLRWKPLTQ